MTLRQSPQHHIEFIVKNHCWRTSQFLIYHLSPTVEISPDFACLLTKPWKFSWEKKSKQKKTKKVPPSVPCHFTYRFWVGGAIVWLRGQWEPLVIGSELCPRLPPMVIPMIICSFYASEEPGSDYFLIKGEAASRLGKDELPFPQQQWWNRTRWDFFFFNRNSIVPFYQWRHGEPDAGLKAS